MTFGGYGTDEEQADEEFLVVLTEHILFHELFGKFGEDRFSQLRKDFFLL